VAAWEGDLRHLPIARALERPALTDDLPGLLEWIAELAEVTTGGRPRLLPDLTEVHALERPGAGFDLGQVVTEYAVLRDCIVRLWSAEAAVHKVDPTGIRALNQAIDRAVAAAVQRSTIAHHREVADRRARQQQVIAALGMRALAPGELDGLLAAVVESVADTLSIELASVLEIESDDALVVRAEAGWGAAAAGAVRVPRSDRSEAGLALRTGQPVVVGDLTAEPGFSVPDLFRERGIRSGISVPIRLPGEQEILYGVLDAHAVRAHAFGSDDVAFLQAAGHILANAIALRWSEADRALALEQVSSDIIRQRRAQMALEQSLAQQHFARMEAERSLAVLDTILASSSLGLGFIDTDLRYVRVNDALASLNGVPAERHVGRTVREVLGEPAASFLEPMLQKIIETRQPVENLEIDAAPPSTPDRLRSFLANYVPVVTLHGEMLGIGAVLVEVTEHKRMELDLRERELRFRSIADNIPQLAWMADQTGSIIWFNRRWYELTGTTPDQVEGWGWESVHHPDHVARVTAKFRRHLASGEAWEDTFPMRAADGGYRWFLSRAVPIRDEHGRVVRWFGTNTDVTEQRFMNEAMALLSSSLDYRETLEQLAHLAVPALGDWCVIDVLDDGGIVRVAAAHTDPAKVELAHELARLYPPDRSAPAGVPNVIRAGLTEHVPEVSDELLAAHARDPDHLQLARALGLRSYVIAPLVARGRTLGAISFGWSESSRRYTAADIGLIEELGRRAGLAIDNARLFEEAQREARMREEILAVVSHDLRNPLGAIHLAATMLLERPEVRTRKHLETIHRSAARMDHLIGDLLDMASIQAGRLAIECKPEDPEAILREVLESHEPMTKEKGLTLVRSGELLDVEVRADRNRILQVFGNLIGNAIKFCRPGDTITIRGERRGEEVELAVADTGPAISDAERPHIFEPYWSAKKYAKQGMGLGLYISKGIVDAHGGRIRVESAPGEGTTFYFTIPLA
jgi:PAS domain S-box-containing protein